MEVTGNTKILDVRLTIFTGWTLPHPVVMPAPSVCCRTNLHWSSLKPAATWVTPTVCVYECVCNCACEIRFLFYLFFFFFRCPGAKRRSDRITCAQQVELRGWLAEWTLYWKWKCHGYLLHHFTIDSELNCLNAILKCWFLAHIGQYSCSNTWTESDRWLINWIRCVKESNNPRSHAVFPG